MTREEIFRFIRENPFFFLATTRSGEPRVRGMELLRVDGAGIHFHTLTTGSLHKELIANPAVEMCFHCTSEARQLRVRGFVDLVEDPELRAVAAARRLSSAASVESDDDLLAVYRLAGGTARFRNPAADRSDPPVAF